MNEKSTQSVTPIVRVALPVPVHQLFDYLCPFAVTIGCRVLVPFGRGNQQRVGLVVETNCQTQVLTQPLKSVLQVLDPVTQPLLPVDILHLLHWCHHYYLHPLGDILLSALPTLLRAGKRADFAQALCWQLEPSAEVATLRGSRQRQVVDVLREHGTLPTQSLAQRGITLTTLKNLAAKGITKPVQQVILPDVKQAYTPDRPLDLNPEQQFAVNRLSTQANHFGVFLLDGVTGSGKTEVYLQVVAQYLSVGRQVMVLVPEIGLTPQTVTRFQQRIPAHVVEMHSGMNDRRRLDTWLFCQRGEAKVLIGTRSALFTPMPNLGLIIVDEEHDLSYKQQEGFRYHARDVAIVRAKQGNFPIILGSATPSLESLYHAMSGKYQHLRLTQRAGQAVLPQQRTVDLKSVVLQGGLSRELIDLIHTHLQADEQVLLFLNRRGWAPALLCHQCGWSAQCSHCDHWMTLHQKQNSLRCHRCDRQQIQPKSCPKCHGIQLIASGLGTEKLEAILSSLFPQAKVTRIDRDTTQNLSSLHQHLQNIKNGGAHILVGTQMLAKGHHFPNVTLVALVDTDAALFSADYRAVERFAQLYTQIAGRAGRGQKAGVVVLQTHHPDHPLIQDLIHQGYAQVAQHLLQERQNLRLPPASYQAVIRAQSRYIEPVLSFLQQCFNLFQESPDIDMIGPIPAGHAKRAGQVRYCLILNAATRRAISQALHTHLQALIALAHRYRVRWVLDIDPVDFM